MQMVPQSPTQLTLCCLQDVERDWKPRGYSCELFVDPPGAPAACATDEQLDLKRRQLPFDDSSVWVRPQHRIAVGGFQKRAVQELVLGPANFAATTTNACRQGVGGFRAPGGRAGNAGEPVWGARRGREPSVEHAARLLRGASAGGGHPQVRALYQQPCRPSASQHPASLSRGQRAWPSPCR